MQPEFSVPVQATELPPTGRRVAKTATAAERAALTARLGVLSVDALAFDAELTPESGGQAVTADGRFDAVVTQACAVTLQPLEQTIEAPFFLRFEADGETDDAAADLEVDIDDDDPPEPIVDGVFDLGEMVVQLLALELDPLPRTPGLPYEDRESHPGGADSGGADGARANPFAALEELKDKLK